MNVKQVKYLIKQTLEEVDLFTYDYLILLLRTLGQESAMGWYLHQVKGPAKGIFQMEPETFLSHREWVIVKRPELWEKIKRSAKVLDSVHPDDLIYNLKLSIIFARIHYLRRVPNDSPGRTMAEHWSVYKPYYNTKYGAASWSEFQAHASKYRVSDKKINEK